MRHAEDVADRLVDRVLDQPRVEHELVARVGDGGFDARPQRLQHRPVVLALQKAHALVDLLDQVGHAVGHRRVGGQRVGAAAQEGAAGRIAVEVLRRRDQVAQHVDFLGHRLAAAEQHLGELFQPEHPERQVERVGIDADAVFGQRGGEFVVRIEDQHAQVGPRLDRLAHQQRHGRRLADAGGADDREVARQRIVDGDAGLDRFVLRQLADGDRRGGRRDRRRPAGRGSGCGARWRRHADRR